ncbi:UNVERIFIED_CONTAM: hypothetical protein HDU68_009591 [Siphonaria sp. JEL0065]|nr:hypothetical protein HDU68_009591 [Siphonaria sp. JEL0065]
MNASTTTQLTFTSTISSPSPSITASENSTKTLFYVADPSVQGTIVLGLVAAVISIVCVLIHEVLRRQKVFFKLFYTRVEACRRESPDVPDTLFGWVKTAIFIPESYIVEKVGLDATMFLRFLKMSFIQFLGLTLVVTPILTGINYFSTNPQQNLELIKNETQFAQLGLYQFSISNIEDGSSFLIAHTVFVFLITVSTYYTLFHGYKDYAVLSSTYLREDNTHGSGTRPAWRANEALQLRTVLVQNIPKSLRSGPKLTTWFSGLGIGEVEIAIMDRSVVGAGHGKHKKNANAVVGKLLAERQKALTGLEKAFFHWAKNIENARKHIEYSKATGKVTVDRVWWHTKQKILKTSELLIPGDGDSSVAITSQHLDEETVQKLRPKLSWLQRHRLYKDGADEKRSGSADDAIDYYTSHLNKLTAMVRMERVKALEWNVMREKEDTMNESGSAFVTFKTQRAAQIACQVLLFSSFNRYKMRISLAPAPQDVNWNTISLHPARRQIQAYIVNGICIAFTFFWIVPAGLVATLTNIEELAKVPSLSPIIAQIAKNSHLYVFLKTIGPPLVVNMFNQVIPYIFEFIIGLQGLEARSKIETRTLDHYFFFLLFNVLFVFTLSTAVLNMIGSLVANPVTIFNIMANTLPNGATFFINYITIDCVFFALELLRPVILIWNAFCKYSNLTPRQMHEMNLATSYLNFGILYPIHILIFIIGLLYSVVAPLILIPATIYFALGYVVYRNQLLFVYVKEWEAYGRHWSMAFTRIIAGLIIFQITMAGMFIIKSASFCSLVPLILIPTSLIFHNHCKQTFEKRTRLIPLDQLPPPQLNNSSPQHATPGQIDATSEFTLSHLLPRSRKASAKPLGSPSSTSPKPHHQSLTPTPKTPSPTPRFIQEPDQVLVLDEIRSHKSPSPSNTHPLGMEITVTNATDHSQRDDTSPNPNDSTSQDIDDVVLEPHVVLTPEESLLERYPVSYLNPVFSKPLPRPWLPLTVAGWWQLLPRYVSEPELEQVAEQIVIQTTSAPDLTRVEKTGSTSLDLLSASIPLSGGVDGKGSSVSGKMSCSLDSLSPDKLDRLKKKANRRGSMAKGMVVVGMKEDVVKNSAEKLDVEVVDDDNSVNIPKKWKSKDSGLHNERTSG